MTRIYAVVLACLWGICGLQPSQAADARLSILGFARDGSAFAFEQFGVVGAEKFPYSDISIIDAATGLPLPGSPFRTALSLKETPPDSARRVTYAAAQGTILRLGIGEAGVIVAKGTGNSPQEGAPKLDIDLDSYGRMSLVIENTVVKVKDCEPLKFNVMALKIELVDSTGKTNRTIVAEAKPPADRFCPMGYGLVEARIFKRDKTPPVLALVLAVLGPGMEGPERRYIAYVTDLAKPSTVEPAKKSGH